MAAWDIASRRGRAALKKVRAVIQPVVPGDVIAKRPMKSFWVRW
jgi:hypothetical protein